MGMTLEHPLHLWTYRLKALIGELGGRGTSALAAAEGLWGPGCGGGPDRARPFASFQP